MFDINFYQKFHKLENYDFNKLLKIRSKHPTIYNIETTNACNMSCKMCPRTTKMTRPVETLTPDSFNQIISQIRPWSTKEWEKWECFVKTNYNIYPNDMSENHFFLYIIPKVIQLHGYGDPLLDKNMHHYIKLLNDNNFHSYFSCNPANINMKNTIEMFQNGLDYIKYSIESVDDYTHKKIRGGASNFSKSLEQITELLDIKEKKNYKTNIVITMLDLNGEYQKEEYEKLENAFKGLPVYIYLKSEDCQWYRKDFHGTNSIHWSEICKHPWMSMTIKSNGEVAMCMEDYNNEIILGDVNKDSLYDIWNGNKYREFMNNHFKSNGDTKCHKQCDMKLTGDYV